MITRIPVRIDVSKVENYLTSKSSRAENIDYPMAHLKENYYPSSAANLHYELFSPSGAIRNRHFRLPHHTPRRTRPHVATTISTTDTAAATDAVTTSDARNDGIKNNGGKSMSCLYHREFTAAPVR